MGVTGRFSAMRSAFTVVLLLTLVTSVAAQQPTTQQPATPIGTYTTNWSQLTSYGGYDPALNNGTRIFDVVTHQNPGPGDPMWDFIERSTGRVTCVAWPTHGSGPYYGDVQCTDAVGTIEWIDLPALNASETRSFVMELQGLSAHSPSRRWEVGTKQA